MKTKILKQVEIDVTHILLVLPVRYGEEDIPNNFPMRTGDKWEALVEIDTGKIVGWPGGEEAPEFQTCDLYMKVCDGGCYTLYNKQGEQLEILATRREDYVPHGVVPGEYGDYVNLQIAAGAIVNWPKNPDVSAFFPKN